MRPNHPKRFFFCLITFFMAAGVFAAPQPIDAIDIQRTGFLYNRLTDTFDTAVTLRNTGAVLLAPPLRLIVDKVMPLSVSLYNIYGKTEQGRPYVEVPLPGFVLDPGKSVTVPVRFVNLGRAVTAASFSVQAEPLDPLTTARLEVRAKMNAENGNDSVGAGYTVKVDGVTRALTDVAGRANIVVPVSVSQVTVSHPPNFFGSTQVENLAVGEARVVNIELGDSGEIGADSMLRMDRLQHLMLSRNIPQVVLRFFYGEKAVIGDLIELVELRDPAGGTVKDITNLFSIRSDGGLYASSTAFFAAVGNLGGKKILFAQVLDKQGIPHLQEISFYISRFAAQGKLSPPPSRPNLPLGGIPIEVSVLNTDIAFQTESSADGTFPLPQLPAGNVLIRAMVSSDEVNYLGQGTAVVSGNIRIDLKMRGPVDVANNVPPISTAPL